MRVDMHRVGRLILACIVSPCFQRQVRRTCKTVHYVNMTSFFTSMLRREQIAGGQLEQQASYELQVELFPR